MRSGGRTSGGMSLVERDSEVRTHSAITCPVSLTVHLLRDLNARVGGNLQEYLRDQIPLVVYENALMYCMFCSVLMKCTYNAIIIIIYPIVHINNRIAAAFYRVTLSLDVC